MPSTTTHFTLYILFNMETKNSCHVIKINFHFEQKIEKRPMKSHATNFLNEHNIFI